MQQSVSGTFRNYVVAATGILILGGALVASSPRAGLTQAGSGLASGIEQRVTALKSPMSAHDIFVARHSHWPRPKRPRANPVPRAAPGSARRPDPRTLASAFCA